MTGIHDVALTGGGFAFRVRIYPADEPNGAMLVWLHGGAFMFGTLEMPEADQVGRRLSADGVTVVSVDYTLAPLDAMEALGPPPEDMDVSPARLRAEAEAAGARARFPVASLQIVEAFDWAVSHAGQYGADPSRVSLGGASAGANLSAGATMRLRDRGTTMPRMLALVYPSLHDGILEPNDETAAILREVPPSRLFTPASRAAINRNYLPDGDDPHAAYAFPGGHDVAGLPPVLIVNAERDSLRPSGEAFAAELALASVDVRMVRQRGAMHGYLNEIGHPAAERTLALLADAVR